MTEMQKIKREHEEMFPGLGSFSAEELGMTEEELAALKEALG